MIKVFLPTVFIFLVTCLIFFKIFARGLFPVPGDLLVSFYFPWYSGAWEGYNPWTTHKEMLGADAIRQIYLWKEFAAEQFKLAKIPLWNPYTFSGQPLMANFQSSVFYPANIFYFLTNPRNAWILLVTVQPFLGGVFMYLATRSFKLDRIPSMFAATAFMFSSYLITWLENGNVANSYIWLPLAIWATNGFFEKLKFRYFLALTLSLSMAVLAGHPQTAIYIYMAVTIFWLYKSFSLKLPLVFPFVLAIISSLAASAVQLVPTYYFYKISPVSLPFSKEVFDRSILPYKNLITFFASDFFGHPANNNFWSQSYGDFTPYFGIIPLVFAFWGIYHLWHTGFVKFATFVAVLFIISAISSPITYLIKTLQIPVLDSTTPSRFISVSIFFLIIVSAFGFADFLKNTGDQKYFKRFLRFLIPIGAIYLLFWIFAIFGTRFLEPRDTWQINLAVTRRNLILPTLMFLAVPVLASMMQVASQRVKQLQPLATPLLIIGLFAAVLTGGVYYSNKFLPVAPKQFIFPDHPLFTWIKNNAGIDRFYGGGTAHIDYNFPTHYQVYGAEGYDTLRLERYAQLLASAKTGSVPESYLRSDGVFPSEENGYRKRLFDLLGVKYLLDKEDNPKTGRDWHYERFPGDRVEGFWQAGKFQVYIRPTALPRVFLTTKYEIATDRQIIAKIYDTNFNLETLLLEKEPPVSIVDDHQPISLPRIIKYAPGEVTVETEADKNVLLFISDSHDPDWQVKIDGATRELLRAHYALQAVAVPKGKHTVSLKYQPQSFTIGAITSSSALTGFLLLGLYMRAKKKF